MSGKIGLIALLSVSLTTGCTTVDPVTAANQEYNQCLGYGHQEGSSSLANCQLALSEGRKARQAQTGAAIGQAAIVAGAVVVGAAAVAAASQPTYVYQPVYYRRCNYWGCW
jgi:hypothetical protein